MSRPMILREEAEEDIRTIHRDHEQIRPGLGKQFMSRLRITLAQIESQPQLFGKVWRNVRSVRVRKFRYVVYYIAFRDHIDVVAVVHGSRHDSNWKSRV